MTEIFDPLASSKLITSGYRRYLRSLLPLKDPRLAAALDAEISRNPLTSGPFLESSPPFRTGATLADLVHEGVLCPSFADLGSTALPMQRPLYAHQETAIRKVIAGRNVVVASGTGSGKTESFLLPILNALAAEHARGELGPGVRALLLYPMNALANDQVKRLRQLLAATPHITFGRYVGATPAHDRDAAENFALLNPGEPRLPNELISRDQMRAAPPHLLLTNYAMLEYLLLRPADIELFEGGGSGRWNFVAVDEAHVYDGAKAAELAMLLRRLRDRVAPGRALTCIATSATVGDDPQAVAQFARRLFDADFDWDPQDTARQDLVPAAWQQMPDGPFWGPLDPGQYRQISVAEDPGQELLRLASEHDGPAGNDPGTVFAHERRVAALRGELADRPRQLGEIAPRLFGESPDAEALLTTLVMAASRITDSSGSPVLSARYHLFARASEGAYTCLAATGPHVSLSRHETCPACSGAMFEFGTCKRCGSVYLCGAIRQLGDRLTFGPRQKPTDRQVWLLVGDTAVVLDEDDETLDSDPADLDAENAFVCAGCGTLYAPGSSGCTQDGCAENVLWPVHRLKTRQDSVSGCLACGARGASMVRRFETGSDAAAAVLSTSLYQALPPMTTGEQADQPGQGRKLLLFSDSRQAAAFFAPYLETSYQTLQHRRLILTGLGAAYDGEAAQVDDVSYHTIRAANDALVFQRRMSRQERQRHASLWLMQEMVATDDRQSLEGRGMIQVRMGRMAGWQIPAALSGLGFSEDEAWSLLEELVRTLRQQGAMTMPEDVQHSDEAFDPRRGPIFVRSDTADAKRKVLSWLPTRGLNRRLDYVTRLLAAMNSEADPAAVLAGCWRFLTGLRDAWLTSASAGTVGVVWQVDHTWLRLSPVGPEDRLYRCDSCQRLAAVSVRGICSTLACRGGLQEHQIPDGSDDPDHYRFLYRTLRPVPLTASEHTGQLANIEAADIQQRFLRGEVNALSCSTTFELGVDVGELQSVVLRNMPPTTANYVQRAGRAGRRVDSAALVLTYAQRRSHDLSRYLDPIAMIAGEIRAPYVPLANERIDRRHAHSVALAAFFRHSKELSGEEWHNVGEFFLPGPSRTRPACDRVRGYLSPVPPEIDQSLRRILPPSVQEEIGVDSSAWVIGLDDLITQVRDELMSDVDAFEERREVAFKKRQGHLVAQCERTINTLRKRPLLNVLANRNVLPKYGFPTDTVELKTAYADSRLGDKLDLSRDLSSAIYEFAPGAELVAGGQLWTSGGIYRLPDRELITKFYAVCPSCAGYREDDEPLDPQCPSCSVQLTGVPRQYCVPEFGFVAQRGPRRPGMNPPKRSWNGKTYVLSLAAEVTEKSWPLANGGNATTRAGSRGQLIAVSEGPNMAGYQICDWCGWGIPVGAKAPASHRHLLRDQDCTGYLRHRALAHRYETDIAEITFDELAGPSAGSGQYRSVLYAILEGVSERLQISRDDIDGTLFPKPGGRTALAVFDTVPGGAGSAMRLASAFDEVLNAALERVSRCDCGEETSCYGCLRGYRNQPFHDELRRGAAMDFLNPFVSP